MKSCLLINFIPTYITIILDTLKDIFRNMILLTKIEI